MKIAQRRVPVRMRKFIARDCSHCGTTFSPNSPARKYCSAKCKADRAEKLIGTGPRPCGVCAAPITNKKLKYCSDTCRKEGYFRTLVGKQRRAT